jgi:hypothetical protein
MLFTAPAELPQELQPVDVNSPNTTTLSAATPLVASISSISTGISFIGFLLRILVKLVCLYIQVSLPGSIGSLY